MSSAQASDDGGGLQVISYVHLATGVAYGQPGAIKAWAVSLQHVACAAKHMEEHRQDGTHTDKTSVMPTEPRIEKRQIANTKTEHQRQ